MYPFEYDKVPLNPRVEKRGNHNLIIIDAPYEPDVPQSKRIHIYDFQAEPPFMNLIFLHGIGNGNIPYLMWFGEKFRNHGIRTFFLILPYHHERAPKSWTGGELFFSSSPSHCVVRFHQAVIDVRRTVDYIETISNLPVSVMGFSFGGMIATMALAIDKRIKKGILAFTGGDWRWINWYSSYLESVRIMYKEKGNEMGCRSENDCVLKRGSAVKTVEGFNTVEDIFKHPVTCYHYDPVSYGKFVSQKILFFHGIFDRVISKKSTRALLSVLKDVQSVLIPSGHKSSYFFRRFIARKSIRFLKDS
jgi:pimeloyl-ACP methyl ester carboxylesterase